MLIRQGHLDEASELLDGVLQEAQVSADPERASEALEGLGLVALARGDYETAGPLLEQSLESTADADPGERTALYWGLVEVHAHTGDTARAMAVLENCLTRLRRSPMPDPAKVVRYSLWLSRSYAEAGDHARAGAALADALRHGDVRVDLPSRAAAAFAIARAHAANGRIDQAIRHTDRALALYDLRDDNQALRESHLVYAQALLDISDTAAAAGHLSAARGLLEAEPDAWELGALEVEEARMALLSGDAETAAAKALNAVEMLQAAADPRRSATPTWCSPGSRTSWARSNGRALLHARGGRVHGCRQSARTGQGVSLVRQVPEAARPRRGGTRSLRAGCRPDSIDARLARSGARPQPDSSHIEHRRCAHACALLHSQRIFMHLRHDALG